MSGSPSDVPPHIRSAFLNGEIHTLYSSWPTGRPSSPTDRKSDTWSRTIISLALAHSAFTSLLSALQYPNSYGMASDIFIAVQDSGTDYAPLVRGLLDVGMNPNWHRGHWSTTALFTDAVESGEPDIVRLLLEKGVDVDTMEDEDMKPNLDLVGTASQGAEVRKIILEWEMRKAAEAEERNKRGTRSAKLHFAAFEGRAQDIRRLVIEEGANPNVMSSAEEFKIAKKEMGSPLHFAVEAKQMDAVGQLLDLGADPKARDAKGRSVLERSAVVDGNIWRELRGLKAFEDQN